MKITRENYETFFLDYLEGNLDEQLMDDFIDFLQQNADLKKELELFESITIPDISLEFPGKEKLYRHSLDHTPIFEKWAVASMEGDLNETEKQEFELYIENHPEKKKEFELFEKTRLIPDLSVTFSKKDLLYRKAILRPLLMWSVRVAAVLLVAIALWNLWPEDGPETIMQPQISQVEQIPGDSGTVVAEPQEGVEDQLYAAETSQKSLPAIESVQLPSKDIYPETNAQTETDLLKASQELNFLPVKKAHIETAPISTALAVNATFAATEPSSPIETEEYISDKIRQKIGLEGFTFARLVRSGLDLASNITDEKLSYATNTDGDIVALSLDTRLIGLRIPVGKK